MMEGDTEILTATVKPDKATDKTVSWSSSDSSIASVDENGKVTAIKKGKTTITAKAGEKTASCSVSVYDEIAVTSVELNKTEITLITGQSKTLKATVKPEDATDKTVTWTSSNNNVATVKDGVVKGIGIGAATIVAKAGNVSASCSVKVLTDSADGVYARFLGGAIASINGVIQSGSQLTFGVYNYSTEPITVVSVQLINGQTGNGLNVLPINSNIISGDSSAWTITISGAGITSPVARFVYLFRGNEYTCEAAYN